MSERISTCSSWLPKCPFVKQSFLSIETKSPFPKIISFFIFHIFPLKFCYRLFCTFYNTRHNGKYAVKYECWSRRQEIKFLIKYLKNRSHNFYKTKLLLFHVYCEWYEFNFLKNHIYVNEKTLLIFDIFNWNKYTSNGIWFYYLLNSYLMVFN